MKQLGWMMLILGQYFSAAAPSLAHLDGLEHQYPKRHQHHHQQWSPWRPNPSPCVRCL
jgi:hypothetical protein